jgi:hypothetical protein
MPTHSLRAAAFGAFLHFGDSVLQLLRESVQLSCAAAVVSGCDIGQRK